MSTPVTWNGTTYNIPAAGELNWSSLSNFLIALGNNAAIAGGAVTYGSRVVTSTPDTVGPTDTVVLVNVGSSSTINLPTTTGNTGRILVIADSSGMAATNNITIDAYASEVINGSNTYVINSNRGAVILVGASNSWNVLASYEGSQILNSRTTATNANTASAIVARDASGNFTAGTITAALTGNASTATSATSITGNLTGDVTSSGMATTITSGVITNAMVNVSAQIADTKLATISTASKVSNSATTATNANTASAIVARDASGNFTAGIITADLSGNATTATTATSATSAANLTGSNLTGDVTNVANAMTIPAGTITNAMVNASAGIVDTKLDTISTALKVSNSATTAASANTASAIVARDASGNFTAGTITAALTGNASTATSATSITGNLTGDVTSSGMATTITSGIITNAMVNASAGIVDTKLATISTASKVSNSATTATSANTVSAIVARDGSGDFAAGAVTVTKLVDTGPITLSQIATPTAPGAGLTNAYAKTDGKIYRQTSSGEFEIGSGSGSGINYLSDWNDATRAVGTVSTATSAGPITVSGTFPNVTSAWYADGTSGSAAIASSTNNSLRGTTNYLTALSGFSVTGARFAQTPVFNLGGTDLGKALAVQFDVTGNTTADDWDVVAVRYTSAGAFGELIPIAGIASTMTVTPSAQVPTGTTTFTGFFITGSTASDVYSIRWRRRAGSVAIRLDNLIVGPNSVMLGTAITDWQSYTPTSTFTTNSNTPTGRFRRVGDSMEIEFKQSFTGIPNSVTFTISLPTGYLIDTTKVVDPSGGGSIFGIMTAFDGANAYSGTAVYGSTSTIRAYGPSNVSNWTQAVPFAFNTSDVIEGRFLVPIAGWSSNVTMADRAVEDYVSNGAAAGVSTNDSTDFKYGPAGSQIGAITAGHFKRVRFNTVVQATDNIIIELRDPQTNVWSALGNSFATQSFGSQVVPWSISGSTQVGMGRLAPFSSTDVDVYFASVPTAGTGAVWGTGAGSMGSCFWRCRKVAGGSSVGFPIAPANITLIDSADNYSGNTKLGFMQYSHGTSYNGGIAPTVTLSAGGGTLTTLYMGEFIPYQMSSGAWRMKFNIDVLLSTATRTSATFAVNGITFFNNGGDGQAVAGWANSGSVPIGYAVANSNLGTVSVGHASLSTGHYTVSGDVRLASKPTWAY